VTHGDHALAQDVAQLVFSDLAVKARSIPPGTPLGGWLHRHAFFTASKAVRSEVRRRAREAHTATTAATMTEDPSNVLPDGDPEAVWARLAPHIDAELATLSADDRAALVLKYFEKRSVRSIATELGLSEDATRKRIDRALEKMRRRLKKKGLSLASGAALAALLPQALVAPPAGLAVSVTTAAVAAAAAGVAGGSATAVSWLVARLGGPGTAAAAGTVLIGLIGGLTWWAVRRPDPSRLASTADSIPSRPARLAGSGASAPAFLPPVQATAFIVPEALVAGSLLAPLHELDEAALFELVARSASQGTGQRIGGPPIAPPVAGDNDEYAHTKYQNVEAYEYPVDFKVSRDGTLTPVASATRWVGTQLKVSGNPTDEAGAYAVTFALEHHLAPPGETRWSGNLVDLQADHPSVATQPRFHVVELGGTVTVRRGQTRLAGAALIPSWLVPKTTGTAQRLLVFIAIEPPTAQ
jgi:RNA polymerase sigma factor (sigma-70 family)